MIRWLRKRYQVWLFQRWLRRAAEGVAIGLRTLETTNPLLAALTLRRVEERWAETMEMGDAAWPREVHLMALDNLRIVRGALDQEARRLELRRVTEL